MNEVLQTPNTENMSVATQQCAVCNVHGNHMINNAMAIKHNVIAHCYSASWARQKSYWPHRSPSASIGQHNGKQLAHKKRIQWYNLAQPKPTNANSSIPLRIPMQFLSRCNNESRSFCHFYAVTRASSEKKRTAHSIGETWGIFPWNTIRMEIIFEFFLLFFCGMGNNKINRLHWCVRSDENTGKLVLIPDIGLLIEVDVFILKIIIYSGKCAANYRLSRAASNPPFLIVLLANAHRHPYPKKSNNQRLTVSKIINELIDYGPNRRLNYFLSVQLKERYSPNEPIEGTTTILISLVRLLSR